MSSPNGPISCPVIFFLRPDQQTEAHLRSVAQWVVRQGYKQAQVAEFLRGAGYYLIAQALQLGGTVVTYEAAQKTKGKIQIPMVCKGLQVPCLPPHEMLRREGAKFVL